VVQFKKKMLGRIRNLSTVARQNPELIGKLGDIDS